MLEAIIFFILWLTGFSGLTEELFSYITSGLMFFLKELVQNAIMHVMYTTAVYTKTLYTIYLAGALSTFYMLNYIGTAGFTILGFILGVLSTKKFNMKSETPVETNGDLRADVSSYCLSDLESELELISNINYVEFWYVFF